MNLFFRFLFHTFISNHLKPLEFNSTEEVSLRVWPNDLDLNFHLNNGRFLSLMDIGRSRLSVRTGLFKMAKKMGWGYGVVGGVSITYLKSLQLFQKFTLKTKLAGHYDGWFYIEQRFESRGRLIAAALVKVIFTEKGSRVSPHVIMQAMGVSHIGENKKYLEQLFNSEKEFLTYIKEDYR